MVEESKNTWMSEEQSSRVEIDDAVSLMTESMVRKGTGASHPQPRRSNATSDGHLGMAERAFSAAGAAFLSAIIVNPLDVAKTRLQAQAAGVQYSHPLSNITSRMAFFGPNMMFADLRCSPSCTRAGIHGTVVICPPDCFQYKGTLDVFYKIIRQEGFARLWRGTNAGLALAVPTAFKEVHTGKKPPGVWRTLIDIIPRVKSTSTLQNNLSNYRVLWTGLGAQLARDVPFSAICWSTLEPVRRKLLSLTGDKSNAATVLGANFSAGFVAGSLAAAATCPLDVAKTRRQIEKDHARALRMTTRQTLMEVWRDGGVRGLFMGVGPRVGRAGPSVGIVVSFYEVVKYVLHHSYATS
ncbi:hypothetical protein U1Q18_004702 [Sarracenia purpurea var. burkii]